MKRCGDGRGVNQPLPRSAAAIRPRFCSVPCPGLAPCWGWVPAAHQASVLLETAAHRCSLGTHQAKSPRIKRQRCGEVGPACTRAECAAGLPTKPCTCGGLELPCWLLPAWPCAVFVFWMSLCGRAVREVHRSGVGWWLPSPPCKCWLEPARPPSRAAAPGSNPAGTPGTGARLLRKGLSTLGRVPPTPAGLCHPCLGVSDTPTMPGP